jgi:hypothetical protein
MKKTLLIIGVLFLGCTAGSAQRNAPEKYYQLTWCAEHGGQAEVVLPDGSRCDCITATHAVEFDKTEHWAEAIGQSLHYAVLTGKRPGIVLIGDNNSEGAQRLRTTITARNLQIDSWFIATKLQQTPPQ